MNKSKKAITGLMLMLALTMAVFISAISVSAASSVRRTNVKATIAGSSNTGIEDSMEQVFRGRWVCDLPPRVHESCL